MLQLFAGAGYEARTRILRPDKITNLPRALFFKLTQQLSD
jgi:hypothetical protein